jgi:hypothetical protein
MLNMPREVGDRSSREPQIADRELRLHLLRANRDAVMVMLQRSVAAGLAEEEDLVAIVADTADAVGGGLARAMAERAGLDMDAEAARAYARNELSTLVATVPAALAVELFKASNPDVSAGLAAPVATGKVRVVVVGAGGSMLVHVFVVRPPFAGNA